MKIEDGICCFFFGFLIERRLNDEKLQENVNEEEKEEKEEGCESEGSERWRGWFLTVIASDAIIFLKMFLFEFASKVNTTIMP